MKTKRLLLMTCCVLTCFTLVGRTQGREIIIADFESDSYGDWRVEGDAFGSQPAKGELPDQMQVTGFAGKSLANSYYGSDKTKGTLTSADIVLSQDYVAFLIGGGKLPGEVGIELLVDGKSVRIATGPESERLRWMSWDVREFKGQRGRIRLFDHAVGGWGHIMIDQLMLTDSPVADEVVGRLETYRKSPAYYRERHRPQFHFTPEINWMNDPNGLVYDNGEYHMFYQYNPHGIEWGHMSWGHAVSKDLLHWQHLPIALHEEHGVMAFSGSAVVDHQNTSGFGAKEQPPLVAIFTGHGHGRQTQDIAFSQDHGRTWTKFVGNPVLDIGETDFRDPKVFWHETTKRWIMVVSLATKKRLRFYGSSDLKTWELLSEFGPAGVPNKANWECPDLFELPIIGEDGKSRWVLEADMGSGAIAGGSGGEYFTGVFDGRQFIPDSTESQWVDFGRDFYAPVSWSDIPTSDGRRIWIGWMNNWETCLNPTAPWRSAMSVPRELTLRRINGALRLCQAPVRELTQLRDKSTILRDLVLTEQGFPISLSGQQLEIQVEFQADSAQEFGVRVLKGTDEQTVVGYGPASQSLSLDRSKSGNTSFHPAFAGRHVGPLALRDQKTIRLHILVDACSVEVFGNDGETVLTDLVFPHANSDRVELFATGGTCRVVSCQVYTLKSVWKSGGPVQTAK